MIEHEFTATSAASMAATARNNKRQMLVYPAIEAIKEACKHGATHTELKYQTIVDRDIVQSALKERGFMVKSDHTGNHYRASISW